MSSRPLPRVTRSRVVGVLAVGFGLITTVGLTLSDRVPGLLGRIERRTDFFDGLAVPGDPMAFGHLVVLAAIAFVAVMVPRTVAGLVGVALVLLTLSFGLEVAQQIVTATRVAEVRDMQANVAGVLVGTGLGAFVAYAGRTFAYRRA